MNNQNNQNNYSSYYLLRLHGSNLYAKISLNKVNQITQHKWYLNKNGYPQGYINGTRVLLHKYVWYLNTGIWTNKNVNLDGTVTKLYIDHINRDKLDATDDNLRLVTPAENSYNKTSKSKIIDPYTLKPLHHIKLNKSGYSVSLTKDGKINKINKISSLEEAKNIYNMMASEMFGEYAVLYE